MSGNRPSCERGRFREIEFSSVPAGGGTGLASSRLQNVAGCASPYRACVVARQQPSEPASGARWEHDRVAVEFPRAVRDRVARGTEEHCEFRPRLDELCGTLKVSPGSVQKDVIPDAPAAGQPCGKQQPRLQLDDDDDRQVCRVSLGQQIGGNDRLISLRRSIVGNEKVAVRNGIQANAEPRCREPGLRGNRPWKGFAVQLAPNLSELHPEPAPQPGAAERTADRGVFGAARPPGAGCPRRPS